VGFVDYLQNLWFDEYREGGDNLIMNNKTLHMVAFTLVVVGALNWGLVALLSFNVVELLLGAGDLAKIVYILIGASAVYVFLTHKSDCKTCK